MKTLPLLDEVMRMKRASNEDLAIVSGVSARTIQHARRGNPIRDRLADYIVQALHKREFDSSACVNNWAHRRKA